MRPVLCLSTCLLCWSMLFGWNSTVGDDCPRAEVDAQHGVDRLCRNTVAGANSVPLFQAMARLWLGREQAEANQMLRQAYSDLCGTESDMTPELADENAKWQMRLWVRTYFLFNSRSGWFPGRLERETETLIHKLLWNYAFSKSTVERADLQYVWFIQGSENHDLMDLSNAFLALQAVQDLPEYENERLRDGHTAADHVRAWTRYYRAYAVERVARGLMVECGSSTYGKYAVPELVNMADFAEDVLLRRKMTMLLDILWTDWAVEQLDGVRGGAKSRIYQGKYARDGARDSYGQMADVLLGPGAWTDGKHAHTNSGFVYCLATSRYRVPKIVHDMLDPDQRGSYEYVSRRPAKMSHVAKLTDYLPHPCWYSMDTEDTRAVRYTYCTPDYVMGTWWVDPGLGESPIVKVESGDRGNPVYAAIHAQNRWQGIIVRGDPDARIYPQCLTRKRDKNDGRYCVSNHQQIAVQHKNLMIVQANLGRTDIQAMRIFVPNILLEHLVERSGWIITQFGDTYVAFQGVDADTGGPCLGQWEHADYYRLEDWRSPVLIMADSAPNVTSVEQFAKNLANLQRNIDRGSLTIAFRDAEQRPTELRFDLTQRTLPTVDGHPIDLNPVRVYDCPYLQSDFGSGVVTAHWKDSSYVWDMHDEITGN